MDGTAWEIWVVAVVCHEEAAEEGEVGRVDKRRMSWNPLDDTSQRGVPEGARCEGGVGWVRALRRAGTREKAPVAEEGGFPGRWAVEVKTWS
jgi:hypothetical protein